MTYLGDQQQRQQQALEGHTMNTLGTLIGRFNVDVLDYLDRQATVPVIDRLQFQGDVAVVPARAGHTSHVTVDVPSDGVPVVRGEAGGNTHLLLGDGPVQWTAFTAGTGLALGLVTVPDGSVAYLAHPEHGYLGMAPGVWELRRQREQADEIRMVAD